MADSVGFLGFDSGVSGPGCTATSPGPRMPTRRANHELGWNWPSDANTTTVISMSMAAPAAIGSHHFRLGGGSGSRR